MIRRGIGDDVLERLQGGAKSTVDLAYRFAPGDRLQVVTSQIREFVEGRDEEGDKLDGLDYVLSDDLALLSPKVLWGEVGPWSIRRLQLHLSIGQAF